MREAVVDGDDLAVDQNGVGVCARAAVGVVTRRLQTWPGNDSRS